MLVEDKRDKAAASIIEFARRKTKPSPTRGGSKRSRDNAKVEASEMRKGNDWSDAKPRHLVALYCWCHREVYGVEPAELENARAWLSACSAAKRLAVDQFKGNLEGVIGLLRWVWWRERTREKWRRDKLEGAGKRIGWRLQFSRSMLTDYRLFLQRRKKR